MKDKTPCLHCTERHIGCHGKCEKYAEMKKEQKAKKDLIKNNFIDYKRTAYHYDNDKLSKLSRKKNRHS